MEQAWNFVWDRLFDHRTGMFYNHLVGSEPDAATKYLPEPEMIRLLIPNPGGYGTGMEDCMLNAGIMMDAVISRYEATGDEAMRSYASEICRGMILDATVSHKRDFSPAVFLLPTVRATTSTLPVTSTPTGSTVRSGCISLPCPRKNRRKVSVGV